MAHHRQVRAAADRVHEDQHRVGLHLRPEEVRLADDDTLGAAVGVLERGLLLVDERIRDLIELVRHGNWLSHASVAWAGDSGRDLRLDRRRLRTSAAARSTDRATDPRRAGECDASAQRRRGCRFVRADGPGCRRGRAVPADDRPATARSQPCRRPRLRQRASVRRRRLRCCDGLAHRPPLAGRGGGLCAKCAV